MKNPSRPLLPTELTRLVNGSQPCLSAAKIVVAGGAVKEALLLTYVSSRRKVTTARIDISQMTLGDPIELQLPVARQALAPVEPFLYQDSAGSFHLLVVEPTEDGISEGRWCGSHIMHYFSKTLQASSKWERGKKPALSCSKMSNVKVWTEAGRAGEEEAMAYASHIEWRRPKIIFNKITGDPLRLVAAALFRTVTGNLLPQGTVSLHLIQSHSVYK